MIRRSADLGAAVIYVAHPTIHADALAAPWIHAMGTSRGLEQLGVKVVFMRFPRLERMFMLRRDAPWAAVVRGLAHIALPLAVLVRSLRGRGFLYMRHYHDLALSYPVLRLLRRSFAVEVNATLAEEPHALAGAPSLVLRSAAAIEMTLLGAVPSVAAVSGVLRDHLVARGLAPGRVFTVHNASALNPPLSHSASTRGEGILYVGNFKPWHRVELLLHAYARVCEDTSHDLYLVGSGDLGVHEALAQALGIAERTHFLGTQEQSGVERLMCRAAILVLPGTADYGSPIKLFEYLSSGRPAVLPDLPNIREVVVDREHALLFKAGDVDSLANALRSLINDERMGALMGARAEELACSQYTWRHNAQKILAGVGMAADPRMAERVPPERDES